MLKTIQVYGRRRLSPALLAGSLLMLLLAGCSASIFSSQPTPTLSSFYRVENTFRQFYEDIGGEARLGPVIQAAYYENGVLKQFVLNGLMQYDPNAPKARRFSFAPLGVAFTIPQENLPDVDSQGDIITPDVHPAFRAMYDSLGGAIMIGPPISKAFYDAQNKRTVQFFQNLGFYLQDSNPPGDVRLLAYGAYACAELCLVETTLDALPAQQLPAP